MYTHIVHVCTVYMCTVLCPYVICRYVWITSRQPICTPYVLMTLKKTLITSTRLNY